MINSEFLNSSPFVLSTGPPESTDMAGCQESSLDLFPEEKVSKPHALIVELKARYPHCNVTELSSLSDHTLFSIQPRKNTDLKLEFRFSLIGTQKLSFLSVVSNSLSKKNVQRLQRSFELQMSLSENFAMLDEALNIADYFIQVEGLSETNVCVRNIKKAEDSRAKNNENEANKERGVESKNKVFKGKAKRLRRRLRKDTAEESEDSLMEELKQSMLYGSNFQEQNHEAVCSSLPMLDRPTHFIAVRVTCKTVVDSLVCAQRDLVSSEPLLEKGAFAPEIFHLTLFTLGLDSQEDIDKCIEALKSMKSSLKKFRPVHPFTIHSMSQFYNRAIFAKVTFQQDFVDFREYLRNELGRFDVEIRDMYEKFNPHLTIIKVKRPERKLFGPRNIQPAMYAHLKDTVFGEQRVNDIHLCPMDGQRRKDGFYASLFNINFES